MSYNEVKELRHAGKLQEAYAMAQEELLTYPDNKWNKNSLAWVLVALLKDVSQSLNKDLFVKYLKELSSLNLDASETMIFDQVAFKIGIFIFAYKKQKDCDFHFITDIFKLICNFNFTKSSDAYSFLFKAFHKNYQEWDHYPEFVLWWNLDCFKVDDYTGDKTTAGKTMMSIVEQAYIACSKKLIGLLEEKDNYSRELTIHFDSYFSPRLEKMINAHPEYSYLPYFKSKILLAKGKNGEARKFLLPFVREHKEQFWVWDVLADTLDDENLKIACLCKSLCCRAQNSFMINVRQRLAFLLIEKEYFPEAKTEIEQILSIRKKNEWNITATLLTWCNSDWYSLTSRLKNNLDFYHSNAPMADTLLFDDIERVFILVTFVNKEKHVLNFVTESKCVGYFGYSGLIDSVNVGEILWVRFKDDEHLDGFSKALTVERTDEEPELLIKSFSGKVMIKQGKNFGFATDYYISPSLISKFNLSSGDFIAGKVMLSYEQRKGKWDYRVCEVSTIDENVDMN